MKKTILFMVLILLLAAVMPAQAGKNIVGERINIKYDGSQSQTYPAGQPFHIFHGWELDTGKVEGGSVPAVGHWGFRLEVDGQPVEPDWVFHWGWGNPGDYAPGQNGLLGLTMIYNFPEGMSGTHTFNGYWYMPCSAKFGIKNCPDPMAPVNNFTSEVEVTFE